MKASEVEVGGIYTTKVGIRNVDVRIVRENAKGGWDAASVASGKPIRVKDAARLRPAKAAEEDADTQVELRVDDAVDEPAPEREPVNPKAAAKRAKQPKPGKAPKQPKAPKAKAEKTPGRMSCLDAAAAVLKGNGGAMTCKAIVEEMRAKGLWTTAAPTPAATLSSAFLREMKKGNASRFKKTGRGLFTLVA